MAEGQERAPSVFAPLAEQVSAKADAWAFADEYEAEIQQWCRAEHTQSRHAAKVVEPAIERLLGAAAAVGAARGRLRALVIALPVLALLTMLTVLLSQGRG